MKTENGKSKQWQNERFAVEVARRSETASSRLACVFDKPFARLGAISMGKSLELVHRDIFGRALWLSCSLGSLPGACFYLYSVLLLFAN